MPEVLVVSDFNAELASRFISADRSAPDLKAETAPFGQVYQSLAAPSPGSATKTLFLWTRPEGVIPSFAEMEQGAPAALPAILAQVDAFIEAVKSASGRFHTVLVASWTRSRQGRGLGLLDWSAEGEAYALARMNLRLAEQLAGLANVRVLDSQRWLDSSAPARVGRYWYTLKSPYVEAVAQAAARDVTAAVRAFAGQSRKLIVLDLDDTLWGGVVGETGWAGIRLGGHDAVGEAHLDFQRALKSLAARGIALAVVSKNTEAVGLEPFDHHPEMVLRRADLAGWRINWQDKAQNLADLVASLNLGLHSTVFIDDNPAERGRVSEALPEVLVPDWPTDPTRYADALRSLDCFDQPSLTNEDRQRVQMYTQSREREDGRNQAGSMEDWLKSLDVRVTIEPVGKSNIARVVQLANKTNQMNLRTRRVTEAELQAWLLEGKDRQSMAIIVADRFGDLGLTGLVSWQAGE
ncbi:MAG: FkbH like protein, partial [Caulobacteraceae bacterium]|nr:FkbH like protein [Caulobacteraceae bacterium]